MGMENCFFLSQVWQSPSATSISSVSERVWESYCINPCILGGAPDATVNLGLSNAKNQEKNS